MCATCVNHYFTKKLKFYYKNVIYISINYRYISKEYLFWFVNYKINFDQKHLKFLNYYVYSKHDICPFLINFYELILWYVNNVYFLI